MTLRLFLIVLSAAICHAGWNFAARKVSGDLVIIWLSLFAGCLLLLPVGLSFIPDCEFYHSFSVQGMGYMVATGVIHAIYFALLSKAYEQNEISHVYPIARGSGVGITSIFAWFVFKEDISYIGSFGICLILMGILLMGNPIIKHEGAPRGLKHALGVGTSIAAYSLIDKVGVSKVYPALYIWAMFFISAVLLAPFVIRQHRGSILEKIRKYPHYILFIGTGSIGTYLMILFAFRIGFVSYIVAVREFAVVVGALLGIVFLKERLTLSKAAALVTITAGLILIKAV